MKMPQSPPKPRMPMPSSMAKSSSRFGDHIKKMELNAPKTVKEALIVLRIEVELRQGQAYVGQAEKLLKKNKVPPVEMDEEVQQ